MTVKWDPSKATAAMRSASARAVTDAAEFLLEEANRTVPIEEDTLGRSGTVTPATPQDLTAVISYDTPYAVRQHEDTTLRHDPGRRAKWLELTLKEQAARVGQYIGGRIKAAL